MAITCIRLPDIVPLLDQIEDRNGPVMANRTRAAIGRVCNWYAARSDDLRSPIVRGMAKAEVARDRILTDPELRAVWHSAATASPEPVYAAYVRFLLLTGARRREVSE